MSGVPSPLTPVPYTAGLPPEAGGYYRAYALPIDALVATLDKDGDVPPPPPAPPPDPRIQVRWTLIAGLVTASAGVLILEQLIDFPRAVLSFVLPFGWLGIILVGVATRDRSGRPSFVREHYRGILIAVGLLALVPCGLLVSAFAVGHVAPTWGSWIFSTAIAIGLALLPDVGLRGKDPRGRPDGPDDRLRSCREVLETLAPDALGSKPVTGWIDFSGPEQRTKIIRKGQAPSGAEILVYRDEWWRAQIPLRDGNRLRISAVERRRVRGSYWKQGRSRRKQKPAASKVLCTVELRLDVNPGAYRLKAPAAPGARFGNLELTSFTAEGATVAAVAAMERPFFGSQNLLPLLTLLYASLEPIPRAAAGA
jgi:hypothetical protein